MTLLGGQWGAGIAGVRPVKHELPDGSFRKVTWAGGAKPEMGTQIRWWLSAGGRGSQVSGYGGDRTALWWDWVWPQRVKKMPVTWPTYTGLGNWVVEEVGGENQCGRVRQSPQISAGDVPPPAQVHARAGLSSGESSRPEGDNDGNRCLGGRGATLGEQAGLELDLRHG